MLLHCIQPMARKQKKPTGPYYVEFDGEFWTVVKENLVLYWGIPKREDADRLAKLRNEEEASQEVK